MKISGIVLARNAQELIKDCFESIDWLDEIVLVDTGSSDKTVEIAKNFGAKIIKSSSGNFSDWRNLGAEKAGGEWLLYIDTDERVTPLLRKEIELLITNHQSPTTNYTAYAIPRRNILLGHEMSWGGWWPDYVLRLIKKDSLISWEGKLHEQPRLKGQIGKLKNPLIHISHRTLSEMVDKTNDWSAVEAKLLYESNHPKVTWWRFISVASREFWSRGIIKLGFLDGAVGVIEIIYQMFSRMITYAKLWELQNEKK